MHDAAASPHARLAALDARLNAVGQRLGVPNGRSQQTWAGAPFPHAAVALAGAKLAQTPFCDLRKPADDVPPLPLPLKKLWPRIAIEGVDYDYEDPSGNADAEVLPAVVRHYELRAEPANVALTGADADLRLGHATRVARLGYLYPKTDLGNATYFLDLYGDQVRFDQTRQRWLIWRDHRWEPDMRSEVAAAMTAASRRRASEAAQMPMNTQDERDACLKAMKWALDSQNRHRIDNALALARVQQDIVVTTAMGWDSAPFLLGVPNGVVDLQTGKLRDGRRSDKLTKHTGVAYDAAAKCSRFDQFLREVFCDNDELITFVRRALGYTLTGAQREQCWFGAFGSGANGKSTLFRLLHSVLGDYAYVAPFSLVERAGADSRRDFDIGYLQNMRFVMASETREGGVWDEERLKKLTGDEELHAEIKFGAEFNFMPTHKLWFMFNHRPRVRDHSHGFWRRVRLIPFMRTFEGATQDRLLAEKLTAERTGVLAWLVRACLEWQEYGLTVPQVVSDASRQYEEDEDPIGEFIQQHVRASGPGFYLRDVFQLYDMWAARERVSGKLGKNRLGSLLETRGFKRGRKNNLPWFENGTLVHMCTCMQTPCKCLRGSP